MIDKKEFMRNLIEVFETDEQSLTENMGFRDHDNWDSLTGMATKVMIFDIYNADLKVKIFESLVTVNDIYDFVNKNAKLNE